jgi:hypothetical protein
MEVGNIENPSRVEAGGTHSGGGRSEGVNWRAITAGALATVATFLVLGLLALGIDLLADDSGASDWIAAIIGAISFLVGGYVAGRALDHRKDERSAGDRAEGRRGLINGLLSWALATVIILVLSGLGLGQLFAPVGDLMGPLDPEQISDAARDAALGSFFTLLLWALASALGGYLGEKAGDRRPAAYRTIAEARRLLKLHPQRSGRYIKRASARVVEARFLRARATRSGRSRLSELGS